MHDIFHHFPIMAPAKRVFEAVATPGGLDAWWTKRSAGAPVQGGTYELSFGPDYDWQAVVSRCISNSEFELEMTVAQKDWLGTRVGFRLEEKDGTTEVKFHHSGWPESTEHYRASCYCWAMYLRVLKRYLEHGELVPYEDRLNV